MAHSEQILRNLLDRIAIEQNYDNHKLDITPISTDGANYTSKLFHATITSNGRDELNLFAKVAAIGTKMRESAPIKIYDTERLVYTKLAKVYQQLEHDHKVPEENRIVFPKYFGCNEAVFEETILLENLTTKGFKTHNRFKSVEWEYAAAAVGVLAKLHALSIVYQHERPEEFEQLLEEIKNSWSTDNNQMQDFIDNAVKCALSVTKEENRDKLRQFFNSAKMKNRVEAYRNHMAPLKCVVVAHGDYRPSNLMHKIHNDGRVQVIAVDYQTMQGGSPVIDLLYFIFTGSDEQFRAQHYQRLVDHYYSQISLALRRLHLDPDEKYSRKDFEYELKEKLPFGLAVAVFTLPVITVEAENAPKVNEDLELASFSIQKTGELFPERLNGVVNDFVKWDGGNYSSNLFNATITNDEEDLNLFVKVAAAGEMLRAQISTKLYVGEHHVYRNLVTIYQQLEVSHNVSKEHRIVFPKLFACNSKIPNETIVLENLSSQGFATHDRFKSVGWEYAAAAVGELAKLHALSIAYQQQRPEEFDTMLEDLDLGWTDDNCPLEALLKAGLTASVAVIKEENKDKCRNFFNNDVKKIMSYYTPLRRTVIVHGDFRPGNLMHKVQQDGRLQVIVVDYQTMQAASPVMDLLYFIFTGTDEQFRAQHYQRLLDHYHAQLSLAVRRLHLDPDEKYSREDFEYELKEKLPYGLIAAVYMLPTGTMEVENIPKINEDMEISSFSIQTTGKLFPERINGIVSDFVKWGVLK